MPCLSAALIVLVLVASLATIAGAWYFQLVVKLVPCELCLAERWPWYGALALSLLALADKPGVLRGRWPIVFALLFAGSTALAAYHAAVEQNLIAGPTSCTASSVKGMSTDALMAQLLNTRAVMCDQIQWSLFGISLAGYNTLISLGLTLISLVTLRNERPSR